MTITVSHPVGTSCDSSDTSSERLRAASEVGAAIAHQLNGPLTALLLYVNDLHLNSHRFAVETGTGQSLQQIAENALREAERACELLQRLSETFAALPPNGAAVADGREVIAWWSRANSGRRGKPDVTAPRPVTADPILERLTRREREVLRLVSQGMTNKEGAMRLNIGPRTFESHRARIKRKCKARNTADLVRMALGTSMPCDGAATTED